MVAVTVAAIAVDSATVLPGGLRPCTRWWSGRWSRVAPDRCFFNGGYGGVGMAAVVMAALRGCQPLRRRL